jgi:hypothetical protein
VFSQFYSPDQRKEDKGGEEEEKSRIRTYWRVKGLSGIPVRTGTLFTK